MRPPKSWTGGTLTCLATQESAVPRTSSLAGSGGLKCARTSGTVSACSVCAQGKSSHQPPHGLLQPLPTPHCPWSHISLDFITGLPPSNHFTILTIRFSKAVHFIPLTKLPSAQETANLIQHVIRLHSIPTDITSDRGPQFTAKFWKSFCNSLGTSVSLSSGFHPQTNGQTERANQCIETVLRCLCSKNPFSWSHQLPWAEYAINSHTSAASGLSPFEACLGYQPPLFPCQEEEVAVPSAREFVHRCKRTWKSTREALLRSVARMKTLADKRRTAAPAYRPGQRLWLSSRDIPLRGSGGKLFPQVPGSLHYRKLLVPLLFASVFPCPCAEFTLLFMCPRSSLLLPTPCLLVLISP
ncbi:hypothetical protein GJAV_G00122510, partial [Gymnothorax javanicus]